MTFHPAVRAVEISIAADALEGSIVIADDAPGINVLVGKASTCLGCGCFIGGLDAGRD